MTEKPELPQIEILKEGELPAPAGMKKAYYRSIPCYFDPIKDILQGRNKFQDLRLGFMLWWDTYILGGEEYEIVVEKDEIEE